MDLRPGAVGRALVGLRAVAEAAQVRRDQIEAIGQPGHDRLPGEPELGPAVVPARFGESGVRTAGFVPRPSRTMRIRGEIQGRELEQYDFTPEQYRALIPLTATLCKVFPKLRCEFPRDLEGRLIRRKLPEDELQQYQGVLGHYHIQTNKTDPGPAFQWEHVIGEARRILERPRPAPDEKGASRMRQGRL